MDFIDESERIMEKFDPLWQQLVAKYHIEDDMGIPRFVHELFDRIIIACLEQDKAMDALEAKVPDLWFHLKEEKY